jgi:putative (di)nucleoside polyphosphate hydrolase
LNADVSELKEGSVKAVRARTTPEPPEGYRRCVGIFLLSPDDMVFVGQRADVSHPAWQMPQGGIDKGEDPVTAAFREMREEIGTDNARLLAESDVWRSYDLPESLVGRTWGGRYKGQTQKWLAFRFAGDDDEIDLAAAHPEFSAWQWIEPDALVGLVVPFKRDVYVSVVDEFRHLWA